MAREYSDPDLAGLASKVVGKGIPGLVAPRGPIKPTAPDEGPLPNMTPNTDMISTAKTPANASSPQMYIPGGSYHEVIRVNEGAADTVQDYPIGTGAWQSRSHGGEAMHVDCDHVLPQGEVPHMDYSGCADGADPKHTSSDIPSQNNPADTNAKSYDSSPICMDYGVNG